MRETRGRFRRGMPKYGFVFAEYSLQVPGGYAGATRGPRGGYTGATRGCSGSGVPATFPIPGASGAGPPPSSPGCVSGRVGCGQPKLPRASCHFTMCCRANFIGLQGGPRALPGRSQGAPRAVACSGGRLLGRRCLGWNAHAPHPAHPCAPLAHTCAPLAHMCAPLALSGGHVGFPSQATAPKQAPPRASHRPGTAPGSPRERPGTAPGPPCKHAEFAPRHFGASRVHMCASVEHTIASVGRMCAPVGRVRGAHAPHWRAHAPPWRTHRK